MAILRNKTQLRYTNINNDIFRDKNLGMKERGLICTLLSLPDNWEFSFAGLLKILPDGQRALQTGLKKLEELGYLKRTKIKDDKGRFFDVQWEIFENPQPPIQSEKNIFTDYAILPRSENAHMDIADMETAQQSNTNISNTNISNTKPIYLSEPKVQKRTKINSKDMIDKIDTYTELIKQNIEYDILIDNNLADKEIIEEIIETIVEVVASNRETIRVGGEDKPAEIVKSRFLKLNDSHIEYVLFALSRNTSKIRNIKAYLLTTLFNAPSTINNYYNAEVQHDMYGDAR